MERYLFPNDYMADPSVHVFGDRLYIYPSHDIETGAAFDDDGGHFQMRDYHVLSLSGNPLEAPVTDHGVILDVDQVPWAEKQMWDNDVVEKNGRYYLIFSAKDYNGVFHLGVAVSERPEGPFIPQEHPIRGSFSIDPCVFKDDDGEIYCYFGGLWGGQLQWKVSPSRPTPNPSLVGRGADSSSTETVTSPLPTREGTGEGPGLGSWAPLGPAPDKKTQLFCPPDAPALPSFVVRMSDDVLQFAEAPRPVVILDADGQPLKAGDPHRFFEASWMHKAGGRYYFSYSTGDSHLLCLSVGDNPYGPFRFKCELLQPVVGWTTHHSIVRYEGRWWLFHHDCVPSGDITHLRSLKVIPLDNKLFE